MLRHVVAALRNTDEDEHERPAVDSKNAGGGVIARPKDKIGNYRFYLWAELSHRRRHSCCPRLDARVHLHRYCAKRLRRDGASYMDRDLAHGSRRGLKYRIEPLSD